MDFIRLVKIQLMVLVLMGIGFNFALSADRPSFELVESLADQSDQENGQDHRKTELWRGAIEDDDDFPENNYTGIPIGSFIDALSDSWNKIKKIRIKEIGAYVQWESNVEDLPIRAYTRYGGKISMDSTTSENNRICDHLELSEYNDKGLCSSVNALQWAFSMNAPNEVMDVFKLTSMETEETEWGRRIHLRPEKGLCIPHLGHLNIGAFLGFEKDS